LRGKINSYDKKNGKIVAVGHSPIVIVAPVSVTEGGAIDTKSIRMYMTLSLEVPEIVDNTRGWIRLDNSGWGSMIYSINVYESGQVIEQINRPLFLVQC